MKVKLQLLSFDDKGMFPFNGKKLVVNIADPMGNSREVPVKLVMWWMVHTLGLGLGNSRALVEMAVKSPGMAVTIAEKELDESIALLERLVLLGGLSPKEVA